MDNFKNIIVLKDLPSNIIDEAFIILKPGCSAKNIQYTGNSKNNSSGSSTTNDYIIKEAESVLHSFVSKLDTPISPKNNNLEKKYKMWRTATICILLFSLFAIFLI